MLFAFWAYVSAWGCMVQLMYIVVGPSPFVPDTSRNVPSLGVLFPIRLSALIGDICEWELNSEIRCGP